MADRIYQNYIAAHQEWLGFVQPVGLVVSPTVLVNAQVAPDRNVTLRQNEFKKLLKEDQSLTNARQTVSDLKRVFLEYLGWEESDLVDPSDHSDKLEIALPELETVLSPTWAVPGEDAEWMMLIKVEEDGVDLDRPLPIQRHGMPRIKPDLNVCFVKHQFPLDSCVRMIESAWFMLRKANRQAMRHLSFRRCLTQRGDRFWLHSKCYFRYKLCSWGILMPSYLPF